MSRLKLFYRLMVRPLLHEPVRLTLTILAIALGVAVVLAIELAGNAATGSFHSSMETLAGDNDLEVVASGGVPDSVVAKLYSQPAALRISPRIEDFATITESQQTLPLIGLDLIAEGSRYISQASANVTAQPSDDSPAESLKRMQDSTSIWVGSSLGRNPGDQFQLLINDHTLFCTVRGVYPDSNGNDSAILMDIAAAQKALIVLAASIVSFSNCQLASISSHPKNEFKASYPPASTSTRKAPPQTKTAKCSPLFVGICACSAISPW